MASKTEKVQKSFVALRSVATSLNQASDELTKVVGTLDEALKKLNIGLTVWVTFRERSDDDPDAYDKDEIGYCKLNSKWGVALRHIWGHHGFDAHNEAGPWLFNDAPRELRIHGVDKIPELIEEIGKTAVTTTTKVQEKTQQVRELAGVIEQIAKQDEVQANALLARFDVIPKERK
jgi:hypothetical protein